MLDLMLKDEHCGAVSPVVHALHDPSHIDFCGAIHDWNALEVIRATNREQGAKLEQAHPRDTWLLGAAVVLRCRALERVGLFDEGYFAYYEDNDLGARLATQGFTNRVAFGAIVFHYTTVSTPGERPTYFHYLIARNALLFWIKNTPNAWRRPIRYRIVQQSIVAAARLERSGHRDKANACLLGAWDGMWKRTGPPSLDRNVPWLMQLIKFMALWRSGGSHNAIKL